MNNVHVAVLEKFRDAAAWTVQKRFIISDETFRESPEISVLKFHV